MNNIQLFRRRARWVDKVLDREKIQPQEGLLINASGTSVNRKLSGFGKTLSDVLAEIAVLTVDVTAFLPPG